MLEALQLLNSMTVENGVRDFGSYYVRALDKGEHVPQFDKGSGIGNGYLVQRDWIWVAFAKADDKPLGLLAAAPVHGIAMLLRVYAINRKAKSITPGLLRKSLEDMAKRGYSRYMVCLGLQKPNERKLLAIAKKAGATQVEDGVVLLEGPTDIKW